MTTLFEIQIATLPPSRWWRKFPDSPLKTMRALLFFLRQQQGMRLMDAAVQPAPRPKKSVKDVHFSQIMRNSNREV